jgi:hypothetical protein
MDLLFDKYVLSSIYETLKKFPQIGSCVVVKLFLAELQLLD